MITQEISFINFLSFRGLSDLFRLNIEIANLTLFLNSKTLKRKLKKIFIKKFNTYKNLFIFID